MYPPLLPLLAISSLSLPNVLAQIQAPALEGIAPPVSPSDRIYTGDQSSNTLTVVSPYNLTVLGTISLGDSRLTDVLGPQYIRNTNAHGLGFSRDGKYVVALSVTTNSVTVIRTLDNTIVSQTYTDRAPHEAFFAADNRTVWVGTRGVDHVTLVDGINGGVVETVSTGPGPSKVVFKPDGETTYVNHIRAPVLAVVDVASRKVKYNITGLADTFSSDMMISADCGILWAMHKKVGKVSVIDLEGQRVVAVLDTGMDTNHANFAVLNGTTHAFATVAATNETQVYRQASPSDTPVYVTSIKSTGVEPHGFWGSPDNRWLYIINEHSDTIDVVDLTTMEVVHTMEVGQEGQALVYVAGAVPSGDGLQNLGRQGIASEPALNKLVTVEENEKSGPRHTNATPSALITVRPQAGLDMFQVIGRNLKLNGTYTESASCVGCNGVQIPLATFNATTPTSNGCGVAPQVLGFFHFKGVYDLDSVQIKET